VTRLGLTLPSFRADPEVPIAVATAAEAAGLDGVFAYDHLYRVAADGSRRPALECTTLLGAVGVETERIALGSLVLRASLRPPATVRVALDTLARIAGPRLIVGIGAGDSESREENETYGLGFGPESERVARLAAAVAALRGRDYPVWVGGSAAHIGEIAAGADGWNRWGASVDRFSRELGDVLSRPGAGAREGEPLVASWGGLVVVASSDAAAEEKAKRLGVRPGVIVGGPARVADALRAYADAGAAWVIAGPVDSSDPENAAHLAEVRRLLH
jgi:alkanesulfonate monooxygenase SsuD/methylene tetrahydromethanopterin reductase-like flavin-dependent oxidoreductase (luciferase family)